MFSSVSTIVTRMFIVAPSGIPARCAVLAGARTDGTERRHSAPPDARPPAPAEPEPDRLLVDELEERHVAGVGGVGPAHPGRGALRDLQPARRELHVFRRRRV